MKSAMPLATFEFIGTYKSWNIAPVSPKNKSNEVADGSNEDELEDDTTKSEQVLAIGGEAEITK